MSGEGEGQEVGAGEKHFKKGLVNSFKGKRDPEDTGWKVLPLQFGYHQEPSWQALGGRQAGVC